jgi:hypothetical protein
LMDPFLYSQRVAAGALGSEEIVAKIERKDFNLIILHWNFHYPTPHTQHIDALPAEVMEAMRENYGIDRKIGDYFLYRSNPAGKSE